MRLMHADAHRGGGSADGRDPGERVAEAGQRATLETGVRDFVPGLRGRITPPSSLTINPLPNWGTASPSRGLPKANASGSGSPSWLPQDWAEIPMGFRAVKGALREASCDMSCYREARCPKHASLSRGRCLHASLEMPGRSPTPFDVQSAWGRYHVLPTV
jgi:hypothetical protein